MNESEYQDFIIKESAQDEIKDQLEHETRLQLLRQNHSTSPISTPLPRNLTFAEATMAARSSRSRRRNETLDDGPDMILGGPMTLESLGPFKYTFKKKKNSKSKYSTPASNIDGNGSDNGGGGVSLGINTVGRTNNDLGHMGHMNHSETTSEVGTDPDPDLVGGRSGGSSRPISPTLTPQFKSSHDALNKNSISQQQPEQQEEQPNYSEFTFTAPAPRRVIQILRKDSENLKHSNILGEKNENDIEDDNDKESNHTDEVQSIPSTTALSANESLADSIQPLVIQPPDLFRISTITYSSTENTRIHTLNTIDSGIGLNHSSLDFSKCDDSDTQSVKDKSDAVMARIVGSTSSMMRAMNDLTTINDGFDSVEWDPDLPVRSVNNSPEPLSVETQPVAYTTVGSRVNPNLQPQISAPNRIQREGSIRRPQLDSTHNRQAGYYPHTRGPLPPLNMQNSMHYAQQLGQASNTFNTPPATSTRSGRSIRPSQRLSQSEQESQTLLRLQGMINLRAPIGHYPVSPNTPTPASHQNHISSISSEEQEIGRGNDVQGPISGLEKMQTLQRLARFPNPMQTSALRRLSELQAPKSDSSTAHNADFEAAGQRFEYLLRTSKDKAMLEDTQAAKNGELDRAYTFPPPGISNTAYNPLYGAYGGSSGNARDSTHRGVQGYPQPLTAGPPGQRSYANNRHNSTYSEDTWAQDQVAAKQNSNASSGPISPWQEAKIPNEQYSAQVPAPAPSARATDTISMQEALQYYPHGFPSDMTGRYTRLSVEVQKEMGLLADEETPEQARARKQKEKDEWFYGGQKRWNMTTEDHIKEIEIHTNPFGNIGPPKKGLPSDSRPLPGITIPEMKKKTIPEVIAPMLDGTFGNMFAIEAQQKDSSPVSPFNRYSKSPEWHIDSSEKGNDSFFGEDWGVPTNVPTTQSARIQRY